MKGLSIILLFLFSIPLIAQEKALEMSKTGSEEIRIFKENKRVKIKTFEGEKYIGRFQILDDNTIEIEGNLIPLNSISNIKSRTALAGILGTVILVYGLLVVVAATLVYITTQNTEAFYIVGVGALFASTGIFFNEFARNYRHKNEWTYKIIEQ